MTEKWVNEKQSKLTPRFC